MATHIISKIFILVLALALIPQKASAADVPIPAKKEVSLEKIEEQIEKEKRVTKKLEKGIEA